MKEEEGPVFRAVYFLPTECLNDPKEMVVRYIVLKPGTTGAEDGDSVRLYQKRKVEKSGWLKGVWGQNVADQKVEVAGWALNEIIAEQERKQAALMELAKGEAAWCEFLESL